MGGAAESVGEAPPGPALQGRHQPCSPHLRDREQRLPPVAREVPLLLDQVFLLLGRQDAAVQAAAGRGAACGHRTERGFLHAVGSRHRSHYGTAGASNRTQSPAKNKPAPPLSRSHGMKAARGNVPTRDGAGSRPEIGVHFSRDSGVGCASGSRGRDLIHFLQL